MSCGRRTTPHKTFGFCHRYGEYMPELGVKIRVEQEQDWWWSIRCNGCVDPVNTVMIYKRDEALAIALEHQKTCHPRDLVAFSINP